MLISRNAKSGWRMQWMISEIGWIAYAHICLACCISPARPDLVYPFLSRGYGFCSSNIVSTVNCLLTNGRINNFWTVKRLITITFVNEHWISNMTYITGNTEPYAIHDMSVM